jgi:uracil-DNA glycosylase family 4
MARQPVSAATGKITDRPQKHVSASVRHGDRYASPMGRPPPAPDTLGALSAEIVACRACPRLAAWREASAANPPARFRGEEYHARPVPGFGDPSARILLLGLAPAKDGGNRTGRVFTGDRCGDFLFASLHRVGLASQPTSIGRGDGLQLDGAYVAAAVRCAPPDNKPLPDERDRCAPYLRRELALLAELRVIVALGAFAWEAALRTVEAAGGALPRPLPRFGHGAEAAAGPHAILGTYHPSQRNTFTGRLTPAMLDTVLARARKLATSGQA